jgi:hypothetical protein
MDCPDQRRVRSPIRIGVFDLKECTFPCLPAGRELAGLLRPPKPWRRWIFPARTERYVRAGVTFFATKKSDKRKSTIKEN